MKTNNKLYIVHQYIQGLFYFAAPPLVETNHALKTTKPRLYLNKKNTFVEKNKHHFMSNSSS